MTREPDAKTLITVRVTREGDRVRVEHRVANRDWEVSGYIDDKNHELILNLPVDVFLS